MTGDMRRVPFPEPADAGPELVRVVRPGHPLHGLDLPVWSRLRLRGVAMTEVVLPDGSKKRIPAAWTRGCGDTGTGVSVAGVVLQVISGIPVAAANRAEQDARQSPGKEDDRAACATESAAGPGSGTTITAGQPTPPAVAEAAGTILARLIVQAAQPAGRPARPAAGRPGVNGGE
jgi:hypothetical protein